MEAQKKQDIVVSVASVDQLFNPPDIDPFSERAIELLGMSGLMYIVRQLQTHRRDWRNTRFVVRLPPDQISVEHASRLPEAIRRYCNAKIEDNSLEIHLMRRRSSWGLGIVAVIVILLIATAYLLFFVIFPNAPDSVKVVVAATISLFAWVTLWDPLEALVFNPIAPMREDFVLRRLITLEIVVEPESSAPPVLNALPSEGDVPQTSGAQ